MNTPEPKPTPITVHTVLSSFSGLSASWMVEMATRYFALQGNDINGALGVGIDTGSWLSTAYAVCEPIGVVMGAWLGIALSLRRMLLTGVVIFLMGSVIPLMVPSYDTLMLSRIITGLAGGIIMPQAIIIQLRAWGPTRAPLAIVLFLCAPTAAPQLGGVLGAWGVEHFDWSFVLWAALPPGILALAIGLSGVIVPAALVQLQGFRPEQVAPALWSVLWPQALSYAACVILLTRKIIEVRAMIIAGLAVVAGSAFFNLQITSEWQVGDLYVGQLLQGVGLPMIAVPLVDIFVASLRPPVESLPAASVLNLSRVLSAMIATAWATTSLRLNSESKLGELLSNTGFYHDGRGTSLASLAARMAHTTPDPMFARAQSVQIIASAAHRQGAVLGIASTLSALGWLLFASCLLIVLMAEFGSGKVPRPPEIRP